MSNYFQCKRDNVIKITIDASIQVELNKDSWQRSLTISCPRIGKVSATSKVEQSSGDTNENIEELGVDTSSFPMTPEQIRNRKLWRDRSSLSNSANLPCISKSTSRLLGYGTGKYKPIQLDYSYGISLHSTQADLFQSTNSISKVWRHHYRMKSQEIQKLECRKEVNFLELSEIVSQPDISIEEDFTLDL